MGEFQENSATQGAGVVGGNASAPWQTLSSGFEQARAREDSLDRLVEWPAQRALLGDVTGLAILDAGCGSGAKIAELVGDGAAAAVGVDISGNFIDPPRSGTPRTGSMRCAERGDMLSDGGFILLTRTQPIRYALERAEQNGTSPGEEYFATESFAYRHRNWNAHVTLTKRPYAMSDLLNTFSAAGLWIEETVEPQMPVEAAERYPHKQEVMDKYLGILMFKLRPLPRSAPQGRGETTPLR